MGRAQANLRGIMNMARRSLHDLPMSKVAIWSARIGWFALAVAVLSIIIVRSGLLGIVPALATFSAALCFAGLAILLAFAGFVVIWRQGLGGLGRSLLGLFLGLLLLAYPTYLGIRATRLPEISDVSPHTSNPPRFEVLARLRPRGRSDYPGPSAAALQRSAYPDVTPLGLDGPTKDSYEPAL